MLHKSGVAGGRLGPIVAEQLGDHRQAFAKRERSGCEGRVGQPGAGDDPHHGVCLGEDEHGLGGRATATSYEGVCEWAGGMMGLGETAGWRAPDTAPRAKNGKVMDPSRQVVPGLSNFPGHYSLTGIGCPCVGWRGRPNATNGRGTSRYRLGCCIACAARRMSDCAG